MVCASFCYNLRIFYYAANIYFIDLHYSMLYICCNADIGRPLCIIFDNTKLSKGGKNEKNNFVMDKNYLCGYFKVLSHL